MPASGSSFYSYQTMEEYLIIKPSFLQYAYSAYA
jgi:hypothetical protein